MKLGKLTTDELRKSVIDLLSKKRTEVLMSSALGEDCAALKIEDTVLVSSDPITAVVELDKLGSLCVSVCCNDVAANGGEPVAMMLTLILPPYCDASDVKTIMESAERKAKELNVDIIGGHTEFSDCVVRPIASGTAIGRVKRLLKKPDLRVGDKLFVTKKLALEGTCILADALSMQLDADESRKLNRFNEMLDVTAESSVLSTISSVSSMHDVTEGGILGAVAEICFSVGVGARLYEDKMPVDSLTAKLCEQADINPLRLISSGSMLVSATDAGEVERALSGIGIEVTEIGVVTECKKVVLVGKNGEEEIDVLPDELYKISGEVKQ